MFVGRTEGTSVSLLLLLLRSSAAGGEDGGQDDSLLPTWSRKLQNRHFTSDSAFAEHKHTSFNAHTDVPGEDHDGLSVINAGGELGGVGLQHG